jgi:signal transduction histidine kinase
MSSLGQLVAGVAHEINNPVNFIHGNLAPLETYVDDLLHLINQLKSAHPDLADTIEAEAEMIELDFLQDDLTKILSSMRLGTDRIRKIVLSLRNFSRLDEAEFKAVNLHEGIDSTLMILQNRFKAKAEYPEIQITCQYGELPGVECYAGQINQVFMNILSNAADALEEAIANPDWQRHHDRPEITIQTTVTEDRRAVTVAIADNAMGMPENTRQRLFEPFFTTKPIGKGTGMGLSISYQIITETHHGALTCESTPGQGTRFTIQIPIRQPVAQVGD